MPNQIQSFSVADFSHNAQEIIASLADNHRLVKLIQSDNATAVLMSMAAYQQQINTINLLMRLVQSKEECRQQQHYSVDEVFNAILSPAATDEDIANI